MGDIEVMLEDIIINGFLSWWFWRQLRYKGSCKDFLDVVAEPSYLIRTIAGYEVNRDEGDEASKKTRPEKAASPASRFASNSNTEYE